MSEKESEFSMEIFVDGRIEIEPTQYDTPAKIRVDELPWLIEQLQNAYRRHREQIKVKLNNIDEVSFLDIDEPLYVSSYNRLTGDVWLRKNK